MSAVDKNKRKSAKIENDIENILELGKQARHDAEEIRDKIDSARSVCEDPAMSRIIDSFQEEVEAEFNEHMEDLGEDLEEKTEELTDVSKESEAQLMRNREAIGYLEGTQNIRSDLTGRAAEKGKSEIEAINEEHRKIIENNEQTVKESTEKYQEYENIVRNLLSH